MITNKNSGFILDASFQKASRIAFVRGWVWVNIALNIMQNGKWHEEFFIIIIIICIKFPCGKAWVISYEQIKLTFQFSINPQLLHSELI